MGKYIELSSLWNCDTCFYHRDGKCSPAQWCESGESYRPDYSKFTIIEGEIVNNGGNSHDA